MEKSLQMAIWPRILKVYLQDYTLSYDTVLFYFTIISNSVNLLFFHIVIKTLKLHVIIKREGKIKLPTCVTCLGPALFPL